MKKFAIGLCAVTFAIVSFAFTMSDSKKAIVCPEDTQYVWFAVQGSVGKTCNLFTTVVPADLILHPKTTSSPLADLASFILTQPEATDPLEFNCPIEQTYTCAVGYPVNANNFEAVTIGGQEYWRPKSTVVEACSICRVTQ